MTIYIITIVTLVIFSAFMFAFGTSVADKTQKKVYDERKAAHDDIVEGLHGYIELLMRENDELRAELARDKSFDQAFGDE